MAPTRVSRGPRRVPGPGLLRDQADSGVTGGRLAAIGRIRESAREVITRRNA
jgi:hypothetical protein